MEIVKQPPAIHNAFNPAILGISATNESDVIINIVVQGSQREGQQRESHEIQRKRETLNGRAEFDLSKVVKDFFNDYMEKTVSTGIYMDHNLVVKYAVTAAGTTLNLMAVNAVSQIGKSSDITKKRGSLLTEFERLKLYNGYEMLMACVGFDSNTYVGFEGEMINSTPITEPVFCFYIQPDKRYTSVANTNYLEELRTNADEIVTSNKGDIIYVKSHKTGDVEKRIPIDTMCVPDNPFYVRWINQQGGWDYWMFSYRQLKTIEVDDEQIFNPVVFDQESTKGFFKLLKQEGNEEITVGASGLSKNEYDCVSKLIYAPVLEWFNEEIGKWVTILVRNSDMEDDTRDNSKSLEVTFTLPTPQLQF